MSASKRRGTAAETAVVDWLRSHGYPLAERRALAGAKDKGDVAGLPVVVEVKDCAEVRLDKWTDEAVIEALNTGAPLGVVVRRRRGRPDVGEWYVIGRVADVLPLLLSAVVAS